MISRIEKAKEIVKNEEIKPLLIDYQDKKNQELQFQVGDYIVSCVDNLFLCNCPDFLNRGVNKGIASFICKHMLAVINYLMINDLELLELLIIENEDETKEVEGNEF